MTLPEWRQHRLPDHDLICGCSVDGVDELIDDLQQDPMVPEPIGTPVGFSVETRQRWTRPTKARDRLISVAFDETTDQLRRGHQPINRVQIAKTLNSAGFPSRPQPQDRFWRTLGRSHFCVSPEGNGIDCHRTYEAIYMGTIPIVEDHPHIREKLANLPVIYTRDYREITQAYLQAELPRFLERNYDFSRVIKSAYPAATQNLLNRRSHFWHTQFRRPPLPLATRSKKTTIDSSMTLVTALADVGVDRNADGPARYQSRSMDTYQKWMIPILALDRPMVIYADAKRAEWVQSERPASAQTEIRVFNPAALPYHEKLVELLSQFSRKVARPDRPEVNLPGYNALMFQKISWVAQVASQNPFGTGNFLWVDAGLGQGRLQQMARGVDFTNWPLPAALSSWNDDRVRLLALGKLDPISSRDWPQVLDAHENAIAGGCWGGSARAITAAAELWPRLIEHTLNAGLIDDDQAIWRLLQSIYPSLFHLESRRYFWGSIRRDWYHLVKRLGSVGDL